MTIRLASDSPQRRFAKSIVQRIVEQHHIAYFAGGCVRDDLLGIEPSDYDVATSATPEQIRGIFGAHRTLFVGAAFGVVCVHRRIDGVLHQVEVATFRSDGDYSDGRRPDRVQFTTPEGDAQRRDFTINGLFYDPIAIKVIDFVDGQYDLKNRIVRAIGDPFARFSEDKLRLLRAIRMSARFDFDIELQTRLAIVDMASTILVVSPERIAAEMQKMLEHEKRSTAIQLLDELGLLEAVFPELWLSFKDPVSRQKTLQRLSAIDERNFVASLAVLGYAIVENASAHEYVSIVKQTVAKLRSSWRLSNEDAASLGFCLANARNFLASEQLQWSFLQPLLISKHVNTTLCFIRAVLIQAFGDSRLLDRCRTALSLPVTELNPPLLIDGEVLMSLGIPSGPEYARLIKLARTAQLDCEIGTREEALEWLRKHWQP
ncbi:MAG: CCA tRNA nucleotidyltransferase [Pirellulaceae bacterium]|nr:CCA tRNA nucleotidyltransferase [Pirellulaceae bacterium]